MKKILSVSGVFCLGIVLFGFSIFSDKKAETVSDSNIRLSEYSDILADNYENVNDLYHESFSADGLTKEQRTKY